MVVFSENQGDCLLNCDSTAAPSSSMLPLPVCSPFLKARAQSRSHTLFQASLALEALPPQCFILSQQRGFNTEGVFSVTFTIVRICHLLTCSRSEGLLTAHWSQGQPPQALLVVCWLIQ